MNKASCETLGAEKVTCHQQNTKCFKFLYITVIYQPSLDYFAEVDCCDEVPSV